MTIRDHAELSRRRGLTFRETIASVGVWYDYVSLPQKIGGANRPDDMQKLFDRRLESLQSVILMSSFCCLCINDERYFRQGWCAPKLPRQKFDINSTSSSGKSGITAFGSISKGSVVWEFVVHERLRCLDRLSYNGSS